MYRTFQYFHSGGKESPHLTSEQRIDKAEAWLEPRIRKATATIEKRIRNDKKATARLRVPQKILRLYEPLLHDQRWPSESVRLILRKHGIVAKLAVTYSSRGSFILVFTPVNTR